MAKPSIAQLFDLDGMGALVTGGTKGIGRAVALRLSEAGACVVVTGRDSESARQVVADIESAGGEGRAVMADVRSASGADEAVRATIDAFGRMDILVNNAGIYPLSPVLDIGEDLWDEVLDTNLKGAFLCSQGAAREMIKAGRGGRIVNVASMSAFHPDAGGAPYGAAKGGMVTLTKALAIEFAPHKILVNAVAPGRIMTDGVQATFAALASAGIDTDGLKRGTGERILLGDFGTPDDVATMVLVLASRAANYVTGSVMRVDGGCLLT